MSKIFQKIEKIFVSFKIFYVNMQCSIFIPVIKPFHWNKPSLHDVRIRFLCQHYEKLYQKSYVCILAYACACVQCTGWVLTWHLDTNTLCTFAVILCLQNFALNLRISASHCGFWCTVFINTCMKTKSYMYCTVSYCIVSLSEVYFYFTTLCKYRQWVSVLSIRPSYKQVSEYIHQQVSDHTVLVLPGPGRADCWRYVRCFYTTNIFRPIMSLQT